MSPARFVAMALAIALPAAARAQEADGIQWENATELSFVATGGNASASTLGAKTALTATGGPSTFKVEAGGIRAETKFTSRSATGTVSDFTVTKTTNSEVTAESYYARARYDRSFDGAFGFAGFGWDRNTFAGVQNRYAGVLGLGRAWAEGETGRFKTDLGVTYTIQKDVDPAPGADDTFAGLRLSIDAARTLSTGVEYASVLLVDESLEDGDDLRADWTNSLAVTLSQVLAFKTSLQLLYDKQPALLGVDLFDGSGSPTGSTVLVPGEKVDTVLTVALVITL